MNVWVKWGALTVLNLLLMALATVMLAGWSGLRNVFRGIQDGSSLAMLVIVIAVIVVGVYWVHKHSGAYPTIIVVAIGVIGVIFLGGLGLTLLTHASLGILKPLALLFVAVAAGGGALWLADR